MELWELEWQKYLEDRRYGKIIDEYLESRPERFMGECLRDLSESKYRAIRNYFGEVSEEIQNRFIQNERYDFILENLQSHDYKKLMEILQGVFGSNFGTWEVISDGETEEEFINWYPKGTKEYPLFRILKDLESSKDLDKWVKFFGYTVTIKPEGVVQLEPEYPKSATGFIEGKCHGICYHVAPAELAGSILKSGLRCSNEKRTGDYRQYRNFPKRVYLYATEPKKGYLIQKDLEQIGQTVYGRDWKDLAAFRIQLPEFVNVYRDTAMDGGTSFFTYTNIPGAYIKQVH